MKNLLYLLGAVALCSCGNKISYTVSGSIPGADSVSLVTTSGTIRLAAVPVAKDGTFRLKGRVEQPTIAQLRSGGNDLTIVLLEKGDITVSAAETGGYTVSGTVSNDRMRDFNREMGELQAEYFALGPEAPEEEYQALYDRRTKMITDAVNNNLDNLFGAMQFANGEFFGMTPTEARDRIAQFTPEMQQSTPLQFTTRMLSAMENTEIGKPFIELNLPDTTGTAIALSTLTGKGKWVLVDFWATWCSPCRGEIPYMKEAYELYHDKGFTIYGVSTESELATWQDFVRENALPWFNVNDSSRGAGSASELYGIRSLPTNFLIGPEGTIIVHNLRGEELKAKLAELIP